MDTSINNNTTQNKIEYIKKNYIKFLLISAFYFGILIGSLIYNKAINNSSDLLSQFAYMLKSDREFAAIFLNSLTVNIIYFILIIFMGLSLAGKYLLYVFPLIKGITFGYVSSFIYSVFGTKGFLINFLGIFPQTFLSTIIIIFSCNLSILFSQNFSESNKGDKVKNFIIFQLCLFLLCVLISLLDVFVTGAIIKTNL